MSFPLICISVIVGCALTNVAYWVLIVPLHRWFARRLGYDYDPYHLCFLPKRRGL